MTNRPDQFSRDHFAAFAADSLANAQKNLEPTALFSVSSTTRRILMEAVCAKPLKVNELATQLQLTYAHALHHVRALERGGLVTISRQGLVSVKVEALWAIRSYFDEACRIASAAAGPLLPASPE